MVKFVFTAHAEFVIAAREIRATWIQQVMENPEKTEPDAGDPELAHAMGRIAGHGDRVLRVIYNPCVEPWKIVTVYFDRTMRNKL